jgi:hypothetical protein
LLAQVEIYCLRLNDSTQKHKISILYRDQRSHNLAVVLQEVWAEADHAKTDQVRMARDVATMFNELKTMVDRHADIHADCAPSGGTGEGARRTATGTTAVVVAFARVEAISGQINSFLKYLKITAYIL